MLKIIGQCDVKHIMMLPIKIIMSYLKVLTYIITIIAACPTGLIVVLVICLSQPSRRTLFYMN
jgi:hypothetical protein